MPQKQQMAIRWIYFTRLHNVWAAEPDNPAETGAEDQGDDNILSQHTSRVESGFSFRVNGER